MPPEHVPICVHVFVWLPDCGQSVGDKLNVQLLSSQAGVETEAVQESVVPPCEPGQVHAQGPVPVTVVASPTEQRLLVGAEVTLPPLAEPQTPSTGGRQSVTTL